MGTQIIVALHRHNSKLERCHCSDYCFFFSSARTAGPTLAKISWNNKPAEYQEKHTAKMGGGDTRSLSFVPTTTNIFNGKRARFIATPCNSSGMYLDRNIPPHGKNMPTAVSTARNAQNTTVKSVEKTGIAMETAARTNTTVAIVSTAMSFALSNNNPPIVMHVIKQEKTSPVGNGSDDKERRVGTHMNTNVYIAPSNKLVLAATKQIRGLLNTRQDEDVFSEDPVS